MTESPNRTCDGILRKPFLAEHWYKGVAAALAIWLPALWLASSFSSSIMVDVWMASAVSIVVALAAITHYEGFSLEPGRSRYRNYVWVLGMHFGSWEKLPLITHVSIRSYQKNHFLSLGGSPTSSTDLGIAAAERSWQVLLSVKNSPIGIIAGYANHLKAISIADALGQLLGVETIVQPAISFDAD